MLLCYPIPRKHPCLVTLARVSALHGRSILSKSLRVPMYYPEQKQVYTMFLIIYFLVSPGSDLECQERHYSLFFSSLIPIQVDHA